MKPSKDRVAVTAAIASSVAAVLSMVFAGLTYLTKVDSDRQSAEAIRQINSPHLEVTVMPPRAGQVFADNNVAATATWMRRSFPSALFTQITQPTTTSNGSLLIGSATEGPTLIVQNNAGSTAHGLRVDVQTTMPIIAVAPSFPHPMPKSTMSPDAREISLSLDPLSVGDRIAIVITLDGQDQLEVPPDQASDSGGSWTDPGSVAWQNLEMPYIGWQLVCDECISHMTGP